MISTNKVDLIHGNSVSMSEVSDDEADLVIASPPYFSDALEKILRAGKIASRDIGVIDVEIREFAYDLRPVFEECLRILSPVGTLIVQTRDIRLEHRLVGVESIHRMLIESLGLVLISRHLWRPAITTKKRFYEQVRARAEGKPHPLDAEAFLVFQRADMNVKSHPAPQDIELLESDIMVGNKGALTRPHRFQAPIPILEMMIRTFSDHGDLVVDPFAGGATTLAVAHYLNRRAIGYEIDAETFERAQLNLPTDG